MKRIGVLTGGGDCPGLNGAIRAVVRSAIGGMGWEVVGFRNGWRGVMDRDVLELSTESVRGILHRGGTILGSSGANPYHEGGIDLYAGTAGGGDAILIPEKPFDLEDVTAHLRRRHSRGRSFSIVVVAEGAVPKPGTLTLPEYPVDERGFPRFGGICAVLAPEIEQMTGSQ